MRNTAALARKLFHRTILMGMYWAAILWIISSVEAQQPDITFETSEVLVTTTDDTHRFTVEMAVTDTQRSLGLMFRQELADDKGMLFDFKRPTYISMWMRNTYIPLDMLFIGPDGRINFIRENTVPHSLDTIEPPGRNRAVLEVVAGTVARLGIRIGDRVEHAIFR